MDDILQCPICHDIMTTPTMECNSGHTMCRKCKIGERAECPICKGDFPLQPKRNFIVEAMLDKYRSNEIRLPCTFKNKGCKYEVTYKQKDDHECECKFRSFKCEGRVFAKWKCNWNGDFANVYKHFQECHKDNTWMKYKTTGNLKVNVKKTTYDMQIISFHDGQQYFYYKNKVDVDQRKVFWTIQMIGTKKQARNYVYEFEVSQDVRKFKVTEICANDRTSAEQIFEQHNCVVMDFAAVRSFLDENGELTYKFRIMRRTTTSTSE